MLHRRTLVVAITAIALAASAVFAQPAPSAYGGGTCTGWLSNTEPPETIRVGRPDGRVEVVDFRRYVEIVIAREWESYHPMATLEAAAVAVKQYGWWYARAGKWRTSYVNEAGECFDVKSTTADQLYQPEKVATVHPNFIAAIDATWGLTVRKSDRFFLTGYRSGKLVPCGQDATGWKLFAKSVIDCGKQGWTREQIQLTYYAPDVTFHWAEGTGPVEPLGEEPLETPITAPDVELVADVPLSGAWARVEWDTQSARPQGTIYELQKLVSGSWRNVTLADPAHPALETWLKPNAASRFRVRLTDSAGNSGPWFSGERFVPKLVQNPSTMFSWSKGHWSKHWTSKASGRSTGKGTRAGARATFTFTGSAVALVGTYGPSRGAARVYVDGVLEAEVDMFASSMRWRRVWFSRQFETSGAHTVTVEVVGTPGRPRIDVDAALFYP